MQWQEVFTERVMGYNIESTQFTVFFERHAAIFRLPLGQPEYEAMRAHLAEAYASGTPVRITALGQNVIRVEKTP